MDLFRTGFSLLNKTTDIKLKLTPLITREYAARKGTREKARKKKVKVEIKKVGFIPHNMREKHKIDKGPRFKRRIDDSTKPLATDDVFIARFHQLKIYNFNDAVEAHREIHHPQIYNNPKARLNAFVELNLQGAKKNKYVEPFNKIAKMPHSFPHGEQRSILVFCKTPELKEEAENAGANLVGDADFIKKIQKGDVMLPDFGFVLAHPNILADLVCLRALLKKKFPNPKDGSLSPEIGDVVKTFKTGTHYYCMRDEYELDYGWIDAPIGTIDMENKQLEENFKSLLDDVNTRRPKREGSFITRVMLKSESSVEKLKIDLVPFLGEEEFKVDSDSDEEDEKVSKKN